MCSFVSGGFAAVLQGGACRRRRLQRVPEESALLHSRRRCSHRQPMSSHAVAFSPPQPLVVAATAGGRRTVAVLLEPCGKYPPCRVCRLLVLLLCFPSFFFRSVLVCFTVFVFFHCCCYYCVSSACQHCFPVCPVIFHPLDFQCRYLCQFVLVFLNCFCV